MLILASKSAARNALLAGTGLRFEASPAQIDERAVEAEVLGKGGAATDVALRLAVAKALTVSENRPGDLVIGADQVLQVPSEGHGVATTHGVIPVKAGTSVFVQPEPSQTEVPAFAGMTQWVGVSSGHSEVLHKPIDMENAAEQLDRLRGRTHYLHSGIALVKDGSVLWSAVETASLTMRDFTPAERNDALALEGEAVLGSVGGYRLEGPSIRLFEKIEGDYFTILGLPLLPLLEALRLHAPNAFGK